MTLVTVGTVVSIIKSLLALKELVCPTAGKVKVDGLPTKSLIVPLFNTKALVLV